VPSILAAPARRWVPRYTEASEGDDIAALASALKLPDALCQLLSMRGYGEPAAAKLYLRPSLNSLHDPFALEGLAAAVDRINAAIDRHETILVHGDYDVDGICSAALYARVLRSLGAKVEAFVPHRITDGYDLSESGVRKAAEVGATLILTGDCGIVAHDAILAARAAGIDVVVTDHHTPGDSLPDAVAVVNPNRSDCTYPNKGLCGAGVAFKLCQALQATRGKSTEDLLYYLDLVAMATIADLAPLKGENRVFAHFGLRVLRDSRNAGLRALTRVAGFEPGAHIGAGQVSHVLAPRINAVGRMAAAQLGVKLLLTEDDAEATSIAEQLDAQNRTRQDVDRATLAQALEMLEQTYDPSNDYAVVLAGTGWHPGVIGIVASRVVERIHRPTVLLALDETGTRARGSARSIRPFHLYDGLHACAHMLTRFGGHKYAAGLEIEVGRIDEFRAALNAYARSVLTEEDLMDEVEVDLELPLAASGDVYKYLKHFGPFGVGNPAPVFVARNVTVVGYPRVVGETHVKLDLAQGAARLPAIGFNMADRLTQIDVTRHPIDLAFQLHEDRFNGRAELQVKIVDMKLTTEN
jgi:single-stranded-DNA-specific exonuclease